MTKGKIFLTLFPFDDLSTNKLRPALCLTDPIGEWCHVVLAYITSRVPTALLKTDVVLNDDQADFVASGLRVASTIRLHQLVTVSTIVIQRELGSLTLETQEMIVKRLHNLFDE